MVEGDGAAITEQCGVEQGRRGSLASSVNSSEGGGYGNEPGPDAVNGYNRDGAATAKADYKSASDDPGRSRSGASDMDGPPDWLKEYEEDDPEPSHPPPAKRRLQRGSSAVPRRVSQEYEARLWRMEDEGAIARLQERFDSAKPTPAMMRRNSMVRAKAAHNQGGARNEISLTALGGAGAGPGQGKGSDFDNDEALKAKVIKSILRVQSHARDDLLTGVVPGGDDGEDDEVVVVGLRGLAMRIVFSEDFEALIIMLIFANCVSLALFHPMEAEDSPWNKVLGDLELAFNVAFTLEIVLRVVAAGNVKEYVSHSWNNFDVFMVLAGYTVFLPGGGADSASGLRAVRALRALRPLRTITRFESLRSIVVCFVEAVPLLVSVVGMLFFFLFLFAIAGIQMYMSVFHMRCVHMETGLVEPASDSGEEFGCGGQRECPDGFECREMALGTGENVAGFDNIGSSMLTVFQCTTLGGWSFVMYRVVDATSNWSVIFFTVLIFFGPYFVVNLFLAVLKIKFAKAQSLFTAKVDTAAKEKSTLRKLADHAMATLAKKLRGGRKRKNRSASIGGRGGGKVAPAGMSGDGDDGEEEGGEMEGGKVNGDGRPHRPSLLGAAGLGIMSAEEAARNGKGGGGSPARGADEEDEAASSGRSWHGPSDSIASSAADAPEASGRPRRRSMKVTADGNSPLQRLSDWCRDVAESDHFNRFFLVLILINTILLAIEHDGMSQQMEDVLEIINLCFTVVFFIEVVVKIAGFGFSEFVADRFNIFDSVIVALSVMEVFSAGKTSITAFRSVRSLRVIKAFRVLRVFKMFRYLHSLRKIGEVLLASFSSFMSIALLTFLFLLVFAIVGLHVYGGLLPEDGPRPSFNSIFESGLLVFQVLTLEDWEIVMYKTIRVSSWASCLYFVLWVVIGKYTFLTLFLAVTMEAFEGKYDAHAAQQQKEEALGKKTSVLGGIRRLKSQLQVSSRLSSLTFSVRNGSVMQSFRRASRTSMESSVDGDDRLVPGGSVRGTAPDLPSLAEDEGGHGKGDLAAEGRNGGLEGGGGGGGGGTKGEEHPLAAGAEQQQQEEEGGQAASEGRLGSRESPARSSDGGEGAAMLGFRPLGSARVVPVVESASGSSSRGWGGDGLAAWPYDDTWLAPEGQGWVGSWLEAASGPVAESAGQGGGKPKRPGHSTDETEAFVGSYAQVTGYTRGAMRRTTSAAGSETDASVYSDANAGSDSDETDVLGSSLGGSDDDDDDDYYDDDAGNRSRRASGESTRHRPRRSSGGDSVHQDDAGGTRIGHTGQSVASKGGNDADGGGVAASKAGQMDRFFNSQQEDGKGGSSGEKKKKKKAGEHKGGKGLGRHQRMNRRRWNHQRRQQKEGDGKDSRRVVPLTGMSLFFLPPDHKLRLVLHKLINHPHFENTMFALIVVSCFTMAWEHPQVVEGSLEEEVLWVADVVLTTGFALEAMVKIICMGFQVYIASSLNKLDVAIVLTSVITLVLESSSVKVVRGLRILRAIKPLRALTRSSGMRVVLRSVSLSIVAMMNVSVVCLLFFVIFGILGVQLFAGRFYSCNDTSDAIDTVEDCVGTFVDQHGALVQRQWRNAYLNFDHLGNALVTLFVTATLDGYIGTVNNAMDSRGKGLQPRRDSNPLAFAYFVTFITLCAFCLLNLYVGVVFYQFSRIRLLTQTSSCFLTASQQEWVEMSKVVFRAKPMIKAKMPKRAWRRWCYHVVQHKWFDMVITLMIVLNVGTMCATWYGEPASYTQMVEKINLFFTAVFILECVLKMSGLGVRLYFVSGWNKFDFIVVFGSLFDIAFSFLSASFVRVLRVFRAQKLLRLFRISRMLRLVRGLKGLRSLFQTLIVSLPAFWNVGALIGLIFFIYAYVGVLLFGKVRRGQSLNEHVNFEHFTSGLLILFRVATNDEWVGVMENAMVQEPDCSQADGDCGTYWAVLYFVTFVVLVSIIMMNLFTAVIIENFEKQNDREDWKLTPEHVEEFVTLWAKYDEGDGHVSTFEMQRMVEELAPPLGLGRKATDAEMIDFMGQLHIPLTLENLRVGFRRALYELCARVSAVSVPEGELKDQLEKSYSRHFYAASEHEVLDMHVAVAVSMVQRRWRARVAHRKMSAGGMGSGGALPVAKPTLGRRISIGVEGGMGKFRRALSFGGPSVSPAAPPPSRTTPLAAAYPLSLTATMAAAPATSKGQEDDDDEGGGDSGPGGGLPAPVSRVSVKRPTPTLGTFYEEDEDEEGEAGKGGGETAATDWKGGGAPQEAVRAEDEEGDVLALHVGVGGGGAAMRGEGGGQAVGSPLCEGRGKVEEGEEGSGATAGRGPSPPAPTVLPPLHAVPHPPEQPQSCAGGRPSAGLSLAPIWQGEGTPPP